jgi:hypothetical protein
MLTYPVPGDGDWVEMEMATGSKWVGVLLGVQELYVREHTLEDCRK